MDITGIGAVADLANGVINKIWPDKSEQEKREIAMAMTLVQGQLEINKVEAGSDSLLKSGWRPAIGWICGAACAWNWVGLSIANFVCSLAHVSVVLEPASINEMLPILVSMLGLGVYRTTEKLKGKA